MTLIVLNLHGIGAPHSDVPPDEHRYWLPTERYCRLLDSIEERDDVCLTFDDGNRSDLEAALILAERGMTARFFVLTGRLDDPHYCSREDLRTLAGMGMTIGLHGRDHLPWRGLDDVEFERQTSEARSELERIVVAPIEEVAVPFGIYDASVMRRLKAQQWQRIHTSDPGFVRNPAARVWNRNTLRADMSNSEIAHILDARWSPLTQLERAARRFLKRKVI